MLRNEELEGVVRKLKNQKAKEWRDKNKEKVKEINKNYWFRRARKELERN
jgi:hypothetical protein